MQADIIPRAVRFVARLRDLPLSSWRQALLRTGSRTATPEEPGLPENFRQREDDDETIERDAAYEASVAIGYAGFLQQAGDKVDGAWVLEVGPGRNFGGMLGLACMGARPAVADRFLAPWQNAYHGKVYRRLRDRLKDEPLVKTLQPLDAVIEAKGYPESVILRAKSGGEDLSVFPDGKFDAIFSNAVMEHVREHEKVFRELARITRPGGYGSHQVDFRDHRNMDRPLELLALSPEEFAEVFEKSFAECGCQMRPKEMKKIIEAAGFTVMGMDGHLYVEDAYFAEYLPRLRASRSAYRDWPAEDLREISARYVVRKA